MLQTYKNSLMFCWHWSHLYEETRENSITAPIRVPRCDFSIADLSQNIQLFLWGCLFHFLVHVCKIICVTVHSILVLITFLKADMDQEHLKSLLNKTNLLSVSFLSVCLSAEECFLDTDLSFLVPIAVGVALSFLIILVLISYLIGRRKSRTGYQSV